MQDKFTILKEILKAKCDRGYVYYLPNRGNWGDGLIRYGTLKLLKDANIDYKELNSLEKDRLFPLVKGGIVIYGGGGAWCKRWNHSNDIVKMLTEKCNVIVLPSTYEFTYPIPNTFFFCRDIFESKQNMPNATFCHDMAFYIGKQFLKKGKGVGKGYFFRYDSESANRINVPSDNNDISRKGNHLSEVSQFFDEINKFAVIYTDRLHVSIAACLLEKEVHLYPGSYFKNQAVYLSSMRDYFENVYFHERFDLPIQHEVSKAITRKDNSTTFKQKDLNKLIKKTKSLESKKKYEETCKIWQEILEFHKRQPAPDFARQAYIGLGNIYLAENKLTEAESIVKEGLKSFANNQWLLVLHAQIAQKEQRYLDAIDRWAKVREKYPNHKRAYIQAGYSLLALDQLEEAGNIFKQGAEKFPDIPEPLVGLAKIPQKKQQWSEALESWQLVNQRFPEFMAGYLEKGNVLLEIGKLEEAESVFKIASEKWSDAIQPLEGLAKVAQKSQQFSKAIKIYQGIIQRFPNHLPTRAKLGNVLIELYKFEEAEEVFQEVVALFPEKPQGFEGLARVAQKQQKWSVALRRFQGVIDRFPDNMQSYIQKGNVLIRLKKFAEAERIFQKLSNKFPNSSQPLEGYARVAQSQQFWHQARTRWEKVVEAFPDSITALKGLMQSLIFFNEYEGAKQLYNKICRANEDVQSELLLCNLYRIQFGYKRALETVNSIAEKYPDNFYVELRKTGVLQSVPTLQNLEQAIQILENLSVKFPDKLYIKPQLANAYVMVGDFDKACKHILTLDKQLNDANVLRLRSWYHHYKGNFSKSKQIWERIIKREYFPALNSPINTIKPLNSTNINIKQDDILLFSCVRNEMLRLPFFINYYRSLGVTRFFFVDNDSDDGTTEFLLSQEDAYTFWTEDSYLESRCGTRWLNYLIEQYENNNWYVNVDADEFLVFPKIEEGKLTYLLEYMERKGHEVLFSFMLDMCPENLGTQLDIKPGDNLIEKSPYFHNNYHLVYDIQPPYKDRRGGIFFEFTDFDLWRKKTPIIRGGRGIKLLDSSHVITPAIVSDVTGALLHFKFIGNFQAKAKEEMERKEHASSGRHYINYCNMLDRLGKDYKFTEHPSIEKYASSQQLVDLDLIEQPDGF